MQSDSFILSDKISAMRRFHLPPLFLLFLSFFLFLYSACAPSSTPATATAAASGSVLYQDEFDANTTGWDRFSNAGGVMDYFQGFYRILVQRPGLNFWSTPHQEYGDVRIEADTLKLAGPDENRMGVMCRYQHSNYYFFIISNDGYYAIGKFIDKKTTLLGQVEMQTSARIQPNMINHLRADCAGDTLTFYINYNQVAEAQDSDLASGDVGVLAGSFSEPGVDVAFDNFVVMQP